MMLKVPVPAGAVGAAGVVARDSLGIKGYVAPTVTNIHNRTVAMAVASSELRQLPVNSVLTANDLNSVITCIYQFLLVTKDQLGIQKPSTDVDM